MADVRHVVAQRDVGTRLVRRTDECICQTCEPTRDESGAGQSQEMKRAACQVGIGDTAAERRRRKMGRDVRRLAREHVGER